MKKIIVVLMLLLASMLLLADEFFEGYWIMNKGNVIIRMEKNNQDLYEGTVAWLKDPVYPEGDKDAGKVQVDRNNPDKSLRNRQVMGLKIAGGLKHEDNRLTGGWVYDSYNGKEYYGKAKIIDDNTLSLRGSIDPFGWIGRSMKAYRILPNQYVEYNFPLEDIADTKR
jgi:uncharacterized protein (DUF2147 family)